MADEVLRFLKLLRTNEVADQRATGILLRYRQNEAAINSNKTKGRREIDEPSGQNLPAVGDEVAAKADPEQDNARGQAQTI